MESRVIERRQHRRIDLEVQVDIRTLGPEGGWSSPVIGRVKDVSLAGVYCFVEPPVPFKAGDTVSCTVNIPQEQAKAFPFVRLLGKGWVARIEPKKDAEETGSQPEVGVAIAFTEDVTALGTIGGY